MKPHGAELLQSEHHNPTVQPAAVENRIAVKDRGSRLPGPNPVRATRAISESPTIHSERVNRLAG